MENIEFIYSLFNQYLFQDAKNNIEQIEYFVATNQAMVGNRLAEELVSAIRDFSFDTIDQPLFQSILIKTGKTGPECNKIMGDIIKWKSFTKEQIEPCRETLKNIVASGFINRAKQRFKDQPYELWKYIKTSEFKLSESEVLSQTVNFADIDMNSLVADLGKRVFPSSMDWINKKSFESTGGYEAGQLVLVSAAPGSGKSLFIMNEICSFLGKSDATVYYLCLGDMNLRDFVIRLSSVLTGQSFYYTSTHLIESKKILDQVFGRRLMIEVAGAGVIKPEDFAEKMRTLRPSVFVCDYDANFDISLDEGMYTEFGKVYNVLSALTRELDCLGIVASQCQKSSWALEVINKDQIGESSRKCQIVDCCFTIGHNPDSQNHIGIQKCAKNRRGLEGTEMPYIRLSNGRFIPIPMDIYKQILNIPEQRDFTENEIAEMIRLSGRVNYGQPQGSSSQRSRIDNPFLK